MSFLNSLMLWGPLAAAGVASPIIIHLLSRYRSRPMDWAAMELLRRALVVRARRIHLEDLLLLLLRCLALALVAFALSRPSITQSAASWIGDAKVGVVVAVDGSFSMAHQSGVTKSRFEFARARAREVLATLSPGDPFTLVLMGKRPRILLRNVGFDGERAESAVKAMAPLAEPLNVENCLDEIAKLAADMKAPSKECYLITDAQAVTWENVSDGARTSLKNLRNTSTIFFVPAGQQNAENLAVTRLAMASGVLRKGTLARFVADVRNMGRRELRDVTVKLLVDDVAADRAVIEQIGPGETRTLSFFAHFKQAGTAGVSARLEGNDRLVTDNTRYLVAEVRDGVKVLCVDGSPSAKPLGGEAGILALALSAQSKRAAEPGSPDAAGAVTVKIIPVEDLRVSDLPSYDLVFLAGVANISHSQAVGLGDFVRRGGGLVVFLGKKTDPGAMNSSMRGSDGAPLLPAELGEAVGERQGGGAALSKQDEWQLSAGLPDHSVTRVFARMPKEQWSSIRFWRYVKASPREDARVLLRLAPGNDPVLVERPVGRGKVLLFTSSANRDWTDMMVNPAYLMMVQQMVTYLTRKPYEAPAAVADELVFELPSESIERVLTVQDPRGDDIPLPVVESGGLKTAALPNAELPGVYTALSSPNGARAKAAGADRLPEQRVAVNVDTQESAVAVLRDDALRAVAQSLSTWLIGEKQDIQSAVTESRQGRELWRVLLLLALIALIAESILARVFTRRTTGTTEVYARRAAEL